MAEPIIGKEKEIKKEETNEKSNFVIRLLSSEIKLPLYIRNRKKEDKIAGKTSN